MDNLNQSPCSLLRRLAVILYDSLLLIAILFAVTFLLIALTDGVAIDSDNLVYKVFMILVSYLYFCGHWVKGQQTLGMRSWHVFIVTGTGGKFNWKQASLRFIYALLSLALFGLGFVWALFDKNKLALHDHLSKTKLIVHKNKHQINDTKISP